MHCHKAQISACGCQTAIGVDLFVSPTRKRNTSRANRRFVSSFGSVRRYRRCLCYSVMCVWVTSALDFVSDWRNVAIVQSCVCDLTALSAPSCRMQRHRRTTVNRFTSQSTGTVLVTFASSQSVRYHIKAGRRDLPPTRPLVQRSDRCLWRVIIFFAIRSITSLFLDRPGMFQHAPIITVFL